MGGPSDDHKIGKIVGGRYRLIKRLAAGGMGVVYRGERLELGRPVAIKFLHSAFAAHADALRRFNVEARAMSRLGHPHCVSVIDFGVEEGLPYLVMDFVHGQTLRELLDAGPVPVGRALGIFRQVLGGVAHAHGNGIIHRDLKPANVMVMEATGTGDHVRILDFGLAKLSASTGGDVSMSSLAIGTPSYMAPEQGRGEPVDVRTDVYSLGVLLFELLTGDKPFFSDQAFEILAMHSNDAPPKLRTRLPVASAELEAVVDRALAKKPDDRFQTAAQFAEALAATPEASGRPSLEMPSITTPPPAAPPPRGSPWLTWLALAVVVGGMGYGIWRLQPGATPPGAALDAGLGVAVAAPVAAVAPPVAAVAPPVAAVAPPDARVVAVAPPDAAAAAVVPPAAATAAAPIAVAPPPAPPDAAPDAPPPPDAAPAPVDGGAADAGADADEAEEPVPSVEPEVVPDEEIDTAKPVAPPEAPPPRADSVADARALIAAGRRGEAIAALERLREKETRSAYIPYLLGNLYFERKWWSDGLASYQIAIQKNHAYRGRAVLIRNAIRALSSKKTAARARALLARDIGPPALSYLRTAARGDPSAQVRARAAALVRLLSRRRR